MRKRLVSFVLVLFVFSSLFVTPISVNATGTADDLINVAMNEVGNSDGTKYGTSGAWCAAFVSWCARQAGIPTNVIKSTINSRASDFGVPYYTWEDYYSGIYTPSRGDLVFFNWSSNSQKSLADHVGIIRLNPTKSGNYVTITTVEGNMSGRVRSDIVRKVELSTGKITTFDSGYIIGFGKPNYTGSSTSNQTPGKPELIDVSPYYRTNKPITFTWNATQNTTHYNLYIDKMSNGTYERLESIHYATSGLTRTLPEGKYRVFLQSTNSNVNSTWLYTNSNYVYITVFNKIANPALKDMKQSYKTNAEIAFLWESTENTTHYNLYIDKLVNGSYERLESLHYAVSGQTYVFEKGEYRVLLQASNSYCRTDDNKNWLFSNSEYYYFDTFDAIESPVLVSVNPSYEINEEITFQWNPTENTTHYNLYIDKLVNDSYERLESIHYANSGLTRVLPEGKYRVLLQSTNSNYRTDDGKNWLFSNSEYYYFIVKEGEFYITADVTELDNDYNIEISLYHLVDDCNIIVVGYKGDKFVTMDFATQKEQMADCTLTGDIDEIKVMVWDNMSNLKPLCEAKEITSDKFIIE